MALCHQHICVWMHELRTQSVDMVIVIVAVESSTIFACSSGTTEGKMVDCCLISSQCEICNIVVYLPKIEKQKY